MHEIGRDGCKSTPNGHGKDDATNKPLLLAQTLLGYFIEQRLRFLLCQHVLLHLAAVASTLDSVTHPLTYTER